ncbi:hypothetical protein TanjilG_03128 [Lupinus angustifolius]|uniref:ubiquitinyl hydrolase 1 n=1 Tax=Lupinus angustifolius TaxID=3871 RepID=A0A4P1RCY9_LUPAN|nr:hypothetical protein TanjilG_03128 [Lupinus angustifolius]
MANSLGADETILVAEVYSSCIIRFLEDPSDSLSLIRDADRLVAYRFKKDSRVGPSVVFMNQQMEGQNIHGRSTPNWKAFGIPIVAKLCNITDGSDLRNFHLNLLSPFRILNEEPSWDFEASKETEENATMEGTTTPSLGSNVNGSDSPSDGGLEFYITDEKGSVKVSKTLMNEPLVMNGELRRLHVLFLEAFLQEESLGPEDMRYCPGCKKHRQASKKLDLCRLPEVLVIHLKRFQYSRFMKNKLETYVDFPVDNLDLSSYISYGNDKPYRYMLYAISNHYGSMGGGHCTAFVHHGGDQWYDFDDSHVHPVSKEKIKSASAYVLFYRRLFE